MSQHNQILSRSVIQQQEEGDSQKPSVQPRYGSVYVQESSMTHPSWRSAEQQQQLHNNNYYVLADSPQQRYMSHGMPTAKPFMYARGGPGGEGSPMVAMPLPAKFNPYSGIRQGNVEDAYPGMPPTAGYYNGLPVVFVAAYPPPGAIPVPPTMVAQGMPPMKHHKQVERDIHMQGLPPGAVPGGNYEYIYDQQYGIIGVPSSAAAREKPTKPSPSMGPIAVKKEVGASAPLPKSRANKAHHKEQQESDDATSVDSFSPIPLAKPSTRPGASSKPQPAAPQTTEGEEIDGDLPESGRTFSPDQQAKWEEMLQRLIAFKKEHGHTRVPETYHDAKLVHWVGNQRKTMSRQLRGLHGSSIDSRRIAMLEAIHFDWPKSRATKPGLYERYSWEEMFRKLCEYKEAHGHTRVPLAEDQRLCTWIRNQRTAMSRKHRNLPYRCLNDKRIKALDSIGFSWTAAKDGKEE